MKPARSVLPLQPRGSAQKKKSTSRIPNPSNKYGNPISRISYTSVDRQTFSPTETSWKLKSCRPASLTIIASRQLHSEPRNSPSCLQALSPPYPAPLISNSGSSIAGWPGEGSRKLQRSSPRARPASPLAPLAALSSSCHFHDRTLHP